MRNLLIDYPQCKIGMNYHSSEYTKITTQQYLNFCIVRSHENLLLPVAVQIGDNWRREAVSLVLYRILVEEVEPRLLEGEITLVLHSSNQH